MIVINVEEILAIHKRLAEIDKIPLHQIEWRKDGKAIEVDKADIEFWNYTELGNSSFINHLGF